VFFMMEIQTRRVHVWASPVLAALALCPRGADPDEEGRTLKARREPAGKATS
jgi:hypothetical protein